MARLFISRSGQARERWQRAFPDSPVAPDLASSDLGGIDSIWLDLGALESAARGECVAAAAARSRPVIAMAATPSEADAFALLQAGAQGYCHVEAAPEQLREIALVVEHGGLWMPPELTRRFLALSARSVLPPATASGLELLTSRELTVAEHVATGASNREIAAALKVSERTVKAHLTAIFEKLGVRDRVQLALAMNNIPTYSAVN